mgnify:CR=1 FL=1
MPPLLYLDTARLGQMSPAAREAQLDFVRLSAEEPSSLYFEEFLRNGFTCWPSCYQDRFLGLHTWQGVSGLKRGLLQLAGAPADWQVLLANRSLSLVNLAVRSQFRVCRNVLTTDLSWPTYQQVLDHRAAVTGNRVTTTAIREQILRHGWTADDVVERLAEVFVVNHCDGLFLPAVDHLGIRLPIREIVRRIEQVAELRFVFIDAAQAFCQVPISDCFECADFVVAGAHKWLHAYLPMGIGFLGRRRSRGLIERRLQRLRRNARTNDPLLDFTEQLETDDLDNHFETANLASLFAAAGAVYQQSFLRGRISEVWRLANSSVTSIPRPPADWHSLRPAESLRSRIVLFEAQLPVEPAWSADRVRQLWLSAGSVVSGYRNGLARISLSD